MRRKVGENFARPDRRDGLPAMRENSNKAGIESFGQRLG
jgi:hypothetical protein